jgi:hypothetical protein
VTESGVAIAPVAAVFPVLALRVGWAQLAACLGVAGMVSLLARLPLLGRGGRKTFLEMFQRRETAS